LYDLCGYDFPCSSRSYLLSDFGGEALADVYTLRSRQHSFTIIPLYSLGHVSEGGFRCVCLFCTLTYWPSVHLLVASLRSRDFLKIKIPPVLCFLERRRACVILQSFTPRGQGGEREGCSAYWGYCCGRGHLVPGGWDSIFRRDMGIIVVLPATHPFFVVQRFFPRWNPRLNQEKTCAV